MNKETEAIIVNSLAGMMDSFSTRFTETIGCSVGTTQTKGFFGFLKPKREDTERRIKIEISIAYFRLIKDFLANLTERNQIQRSGRDKITQSACLLTSFNNGKNDTEREHILQLMEDRLENTYVVYSYGEPMAYEEKQRIILGCLGDLLIEIDPKIGPKPRYNQNLDRFLSTWKFGLDLKVLCDMAS